jgi:hypothetical protein
MKYIKQFSFVNSSDFGEQILIYTKIFIEDIVGYAVMTALIINHPISWNIMLYNPAEVHWSFVWTYCYHLLGRKIKVTLSKKYAASRAVPSLCITSWFPGIARVYRGLSSWTLLKLSIAFLSQPPQSIVAVDTEPLPTYQQFLIVGFHGYESCTRCLATARLEHTYILRYFGPFGWMPYFSLLTLFLILNNQVKEGNETIPFTER